MALKQITSSQVTDSETRKYCNELVSLINDPEDWDIEQALSIHHQLNVYMHDALKQNQSFYAESELEFLITFIAQLTKRINSKKQTLATEIIKQQKSKGAVNKYKSNV